MVPSENFRPSLAPWLPAGGKSLGIKGSGPSRLGLQTATQQAEGRSLA